MIPSKCYKCILEPHALSSPQHLQKIRIMISTKMQLHSRKGHTPAQRPTTIWVRPSVVEKRQGFCQVTKSKSGTTLEGSKMAGAHTLQYHHRNLSSMQNSVPSCFASQQALLAPAVQTPASAVQRIQMIVAEIFWQQKPLLWQCLSPWALNTCIYRKYDVQGEWWHVWLKAAHCATSGAHRHGDRLVTVRFFASCIKKLYMKTAKWNQVS